MKQRSIFIAPVIILFFFSCSREQASSIDNIQEKNKIPAPYTVNIPASEEHSAGEQLFLKNCIECHGIDGKKQLDKAKDLSVSTLTLEKRIHIISSAQIIGNKVHQARWKTVLSENEITEVAEYLELLRK